MGAKILETRSERAWELARRQHGVVTRAQLLALGFTPKAIRHRAARGRLYRARPGIYMVGRPELSREGRWMAAVLACGETALLSHRSAAALWGFAEERNDVIAVSVHRHTSRRRPGIRVHDRAGIWSRDIGRHRGIPVTQPVKTFLDIALELPENRLERAINEADKRDVIGPDALRKALDDHAGEPGVRPLRRILDKHTFRLSDDELELLFRPLAAAAGLPTPLTKVIVDEFEVDFYWPDLGLVVETDGWRYHRTPATQTRDALRSQTHTAAGLTPLRFSHYQVKNEPDHVLRILGKTTTHLRGSPHPH